MLQRTTRATQQNLEARHWTVWLWLALASALLLGALVYAFILVLDPYQNVPFAPALPRAPVSQNQRFAYPALARNPAFDSAVIGTSTMRLLDPTALNAALGGRFVNLAMNSATAYEQLRMLDLFVTHHPRAKTVILGLDDSWCRRADEIERYTFRDFPEWMFDGSRWNDLLYLFNDKALENAVRMLELLNGKREPKYGADGFFDFTRDFGRYDPAAVHARLYPAGTAAPDPAAPPALAPSRAHPEWRFANLDLLRPLLSRVPAGTRMVLVFPPMHLAYAARAAEAYAECKGRVVAAVEEFPDIHVVDYLIASPITRDDANYWDPLHTIAPVAARMAADLGAVVDDGARSGEAYRILQ